MPTYEFLVETVYNEVVEIEADSLLEAEDIALDGGGKQVAMVDSHQTIVATKELDESDTAVR